MAAPDPIPRSTRNTDPDSAAADLSAPPDSLDPHVLAQVLAAPELRPEAVARGLVRLVVGPGPSDAVGEAIWNEGQEALKDLH